MKRPRQTVSLQSLQPTTPTPEPKPVPKKIGIAERSAVMVTQTILYRTLGGKDRLIRPGYKTIPKGAVGIVKAVGVDGTFQVELRTPVVGTLDVVAQEIAPMPS